MQLYQDSILFIFMQMSSFHYCDLAVDKTCSSIIVDFLYDGLDVETIYINTPTHISSTETSAFFP